ncbi:hypothetical protein RRG08_007700 [Elysia crispata]|uniref:Uncharacterized protein n=1 Tax=Elysia crispata TaxID=231223 RepID=A0AAE0YTH8_9GAST|nr:hypothetical protein RRG08_007700 [Elysia crispata]
MFSGAKITNSSNCRCTALGPSYSLLFLSPLAISQPRKHIFSLMWNSQYYTLFLVRIEKRRKTDIEMHSQTKRIILQMSAALVRRAMRQRGKSNPV